MRLLFDDELIESVVFLLAAGQRRGIPSLQIRRFHHERERCYSIADPAQRDEAFSKTHRTWFREWGMEKSLSRFIAEFPFLETSLQALAFRKARNLAEESADLYVRPDGERSGIVAVRAERFELDGALAHFLRHELMHLSDMVSPSFGYSREVGAPGQTVSQQRLVRARYRLLWDVTIDGRLTRLGRGSADSLEQCHREFERAYCFLGEQKMAGEFETLWHGDSPSHEKLMALARDPRGLKLDDAISPGAACPLCGFATFEWAEETNLSSETISAVRREFPHWRPGQGVCCRCVEMYEAAAGLKLPSTICL